jgi:hypothetical protein
MSNTEEYTTEVHHVPTGKVWYGNVQDMTPFGMTIITSQGSTFIPEKILEECVTTYLGD